MARVSYVVWHCSATAWGTTSEIREWHLARGWRDCGYQGICLNGYLTKKDYEAKRRVHWLDGSFEIGRRWDGDDELDEAEVGAHAYGLNRKSLGLCLIGTGGRFTRKQLETALDVTEHWIRQFRIIVDNVIGHYEIGQILPDYATTKRCPEIDMSVIRDSLHSRQAVAARATG